MLLYKLSYSKNTEEKANVLHIKYAVNNNS